MRRRYGPETAPSRSGRAGSSFATRSLLRSPSSSSRRMRPATRRPATVNVVLVPRLPANPVRAVHVTADAWADDDLRAGVLRLIDEKRINAVELDLKDESGVVGWDAPVPLARQIGAVRADLRPRGRREAAPRQGCAGDRPSRRVPRPGARGVGLDGRRPQARHPDPGRTTRTPEATAASRTTSTQTVRRYNVDICRRGRRRSASTTSSTTTCAGRTGRLEAWSCPGSRDARGRDRRLPRRNARRPSPTRAPSSAHRSSASRPRGPTRSRRTCPPSPARSTTSRRWSIRPTGARTSTASATRTASRTTIVRRSLERLPGGARGTGARRALAAGLLARRRVRAREVRAQIDATRAAGARRVPALGSGGHVRERALDQKGGAPHRRREAVSLRAPRLVRPTQRARGRPRAHVPPGPGPDGGGDYDLTPDEFRAELKRLYQEHYRPVTASDSGDGTSSTSRGARRRSS